MFNSVSVGFVFAVMLTILFCIPGLPLLLKTTRITPSAPGASGSVGYSGIVQPQVAVALLIISGAFPIFLNLKS